MYHDGPNSVDYIQPFVDYWFYYTTSGSFLISKVKSTIMFGSELILEKYVLNARSSITKYPSTTSFTNPGRLFK